MATTGIARTLSPRKIRDAKLDAMAHAAVVHYGCGTDQTRKDLLVACAEYAAAEMAVAGDRARKGGGP